jgi:hypothetical protein
MHKRSQVIAGVVMDPPIASRTPHGHDFANAIGTLAH